MKININKFKILIFIFSINIYMLLYLAKIYTFMYENDDIRLIIVLVMTVIVVAGAINIIFIKKRISKTYLTFVIYFIYITIMILFREKLNTTALISCLVFPLVFISSFTLFRKSNQLSELIKYQYIIFLVFFALHFYVRLILNINNGLVINTIYYQVMLLPFILVIPNTKLKRLGIILLISSVLYSMKRAAFISVAFSLLVYLIYQKDEVLNNKMFNTLKKISVVGIIIAILLSINELIGSRLGTDIFSRIISISDDGGAGRLNIISVLLNQLKTNSFDQWFLGHGYNTTAIYTGGLTAHNDFLEMLFNFGGFGLLLYIALYFVLIKQSIVFRKAKYRYLASFNASIVLFFTTTMFSHLIFVPTYVGYLSLFWSFCIVDFDNNRCKLSKDV